jgi:hypothetical protein
MRLAILVVLCACEPTFQPHARPVLVVPDAPRAIRVPELRLVPGELLIWDIHAQGFTIARAELQVADGKVFSRVQTGRLASSFARVSHDLTTRFAPGRALHAIEMLDIDGDRTGMTARFEGPRVELEARALVVPGGNLGHTLHTALGAIRTWAHPEARRGFLYIVHAGEIFTLDLGQPMREMLQRTPTLRIEGRIRAPAVGLTIWLRESDRVPVRIEIRADGSTLTAELVAA